MVKIFESKTNIVLIGMLASGKSTVGVQLAKWLSMGFIDTDLLVQVRAGTSMQTFQDINGMDSYQTVECDTVKSLICENCVVATGGSAVYCDEAMKHLQSMAKIIFLDLPIVEVEQRIGSIAERGVVIQSNMTSGQMLTEIRTAV